MPQVIHSIFTPPPPHTHIFLFHCPQKRHIDVTLRLNQHLRVAPKWKLPIGHNYPRLFVHIKFPYQNHI